MVELSDGRTLTTPLVWYPRLIHGDSGESETVGTHQGTAKASTGLTWMQT